MFVAVITDAAGPRVGGDVQGAYGPFTTNEKAVEFAHQLDLVTGALSPEDDVDGRGSLEEDLTEGGWVFTEVEFVDEDHTDFTPWGAPVRFGPGSLESITLFNYQDGSAQVTGTFKVYCGSGNEHTFEVDSGREDPQAMEGLRLGIPGYAPGDQLSDETVASTMVDEVVEQEWSDPCDVETHAEAYERLTGGAQRGESFHPPA